MKKVLFILFFATLSLGSYAQKGMQGVGLSVDLGFITTSEEYGSLLPITTLKYQYYIKDNIRLVPSLTMGGGDDGISHVNPYIKSDIFLTPISKFRVYASAGIGYANVYEDDYYNNHYYYCNYFSYLLGIGVEWRVAYNWTIQLSGNLDGLAGTYKDYRGDNKVYEYEIKSDYGFGGHLSLGFVYNF